MCPVTQQEFAFVDTIKRSVSETVRRYVLSVPELKLVLRPSVVRGQCCVKDCARLASRRNVLCWFHASRIWRAKNPLKYAYSTLRNNAKRRGIVFSLTLSEFEDLCSQTDYLSGRGTDPDSLSFDRKDPNGPYSFENLRVIPLSENSSLGNIFRWQQPTD